MWQLAFARCLTELLPNLRGPILVSDPQLTTFDRRVLALCGAQIVPVDSHPEPGIISHDCDGDGDDVGGDAGSGLFIYAPNCPHAVNAELIESNYGQLHRVAYIGSCVEYYETVNGLAAQQRRKKLQLQQEQEQGGSQSGRDDDEGRDERTESSSSTSTSGAATCACCSGQGGSSGGVDQSADVLDTTSVFVELRRARRLVELPLPDLGHFNGASIRLHVFPPLEQEGGGGHADDDGAAAAASAAAALEI